ncbi:MAG: hypothetical protein FJ125_14880 [Deltaproteobacteria bacterium]|nr:hypothetical protein [Deltaproteobacteria bacterium]
MRDERGRFRGARRALLPVVLLVLVLAAASCGEEESGSKKPVEHPPEPVVFTRQTRALVIDAKDVRVVEQSPVLSTEEIAGLFPRAVLRRQLHDQISLDAEITADGSPASDKDRSFAVRIVAHWESLQQSYPPFEELVIVLDLLTVPGDALVAPATVNPRDLTFRRGAADTYPKLILQQVQEAARTLARDVPAGTKLLFVLGEGLNRLDEAEFTAFKAFYAEHLYPALQAIAEDEEREIRVTTSLDWEAFLAAQAAGAESAEAGGDRPPGDAAAWDALVSGLEDKLDLLVLQSVLRGHETIDDLPEDHFSRLRQVLPANLPVAFLPLYWPCRGAGDVSAARDLLREFHFLAAGLNLAFFTWPRFIDMTDQECGRYADALKGSADFCYSGLVRSAGNPKSLWNDVLDEELPER